MAFITHEPIESIPGIDAPDECTAAGCHATEGLALVTNSERGSTGVYCPDCASAFLLGGKA